MTILGSFGDKCLLYVPCPHDKQAKELYTGVLERIKPRLLVLDPTIVHRDFEIAIHSLVATLLGCCFHHNKQSSEPFKRGVCRGNLKSLAQFLNCGAGVFFSSSSANRLY